jgi:Cu2+-exporting ATPase
MAIPYNIKCIFPGRISIKSEFLKYVYVQEDTISEYILENYNVSEVKANKKTGTVTIEYNPEKFDPDELFKTLDNTSPDKILESLSSLENGRGEKR